MRVGEGRDRRQVPDLDTERAIAELLSARGYRQVLPDGFTPLETLRPLVSNRVLNCVLREGYTSVEQVAMLPDAVLRQMRSMGTGGIAELRAALGVPQPGEAVRLDAAQALEVAAVLTALASLANEHAEHDLAARARAARHLLGPGLSHR
jgi:hypothetical protein